MPPGASLPVWKQTCPLTSRPLVPPAGPMNAIERLQILHRFYRRGEENEFRFSLRDSARKGHSFRDYICPDSMERRSDYLQIGERYARVLYLKDYASYIQDDFVSELTDLNRDMIPKVSTPRW